MILCVIKFSWVALRAILPTLPKLSTYLSDIRPEIHDFFKFIWRCVGVRCLILCHKSYFCSKSLSIYCRKVQTSSENSLATPATRVKVLIWVDFWNLRLILFAGTFKRSDRLSRKESSSLYMQLRWIRFFSLP